MSDEASAIPDSHVNLDKLIHHTTLPDTKISIWLDRILKWIGQAASWLWIFIVLAIMTNVIMRYVFNYNSVELEEIQWHLYAIGWLIGLSYAFVHDDHVRVDIIHEKFSLSTKAWIEFLGLLFFALPFLAIVANHMFPFAYESYSNNETSASPNGLPYRWILKYIAAGSIVLIAIAAVSRLTKCTAYLFRLPKPIGSSKTGQEG